MCEVLDLIARHKRRARIKIVNFSYFFLASELEFE